MAPRFTLITRAKGLKQTGMERGTLARLVKEGRVRARQVGRQLLVSVDDLERVVGFGREQKQDQELDPATEHLLHKLNA